MAAIIFMHDIFILKKSILLGQYLHFLRDYGYFEKVSVGGQGGSFAIGYWNNFNIPSFSNSFINEVSLLYHNQANLSPTIFSKKELEKAGIFELNQFRIYCDETIKKIITDIKNGTTKEVSDYENLFVK